MKKALVIQHVCFEDLGNIAPVLRERGWTIETLQAGVHALDQIDPFQWDLLIILGGPIGVNDVARYPFLHDEIRFIQTWLQSRRPLLGICLGAQLIAHASGAPVCRGHYQEIGWSPLTLTQEAHEHPFLAPLADPSLSVLHWHGDTFDLPQGAHLLASTPHYQNQAFLLGDRVLGLQFHLEVQPLYFERWLIGHTEELSRASHIDIHTLRAQAQSAGQALQHPAERLWRAWLESIA